MLEFVYKGLARIVSPGGERGKLQIFIFHRVLDKKDPLMPSEPDRAEFEHIIKAVSCVFNMLRLDDAVERLKAGTLPTRAACITFDDGYLDNLENAWPILKKYNVPMTIFVATDFMQGKMMWNDIITESVRRLSKLLELPGLGHKVIDFSLAESRLSKLQSLISEVKYLPSLERDSIVEKIANQAGYQPESLMMNETQIKNLDAQGVLIGAHTQSHPILTSLTDQEAQREIEQSKLQLEALLEKSVDYFAYPNGRVDADYNKRHATVVADLGFKAAVSTNLEIANGGCSLFELPRFTPWDKNINKFVLRSIAYSLK